jgi:hypothetical protein
MVPLLHLSLCPPIFYGCEDIMVELRRVLGAWTLQLSFAEILKLDITYIGFWYVNLHKRSFFAIAKKILSRIDVRNIFSSYFWW